MKVEQIMSTSAISVQKGESVEVAARVLARYNIGILPVCKADGTLCGLVTDRDLVTRCLATGKTPGNTRVEEVMTGRVLTVAPDMEAGVAAHYMGRKQVRRLPVVEAGKLKGMVSLGDLAARDESVMDAADALADITSGITQGE